MNLKDKYVVITGASSGFGRAAAVAFAGEGAHLILGARRVERLNETAMMACKAGAASVLVVPVDVTRTESVEDFGNTIAQTTKSVQVLINNAGGALGVDTVLNGKDEDWETMLQTNVLGLLRVTRKVAPLMLTTEGATIINVGSIAGRIAYEGGSVYCGAKAAELQITKALRLELCGTPVRVTSLDPGMAETDFSLVRYKGDAEKAAAVYRGVHPLCAEDIAETMLWLAKRPAHVCIDEMVIKPVAQAAPYKVFRKE